MILWSFFRSVAAGILASGTAGRSCMSGNYHFRYLWLDELFVYKLLEMKFRDTLIGPPWIVKFEYSLGFEAIELRVLDRAVRLVEEFLPTSYQFFLLKSFVIGDCKLSGISLYRLLSNWRGLTIKFWE